MFKIFHRQVSTVLGIAFLVFGMPGQAQIVQPQAGTISIDAYNHWAVTADGSGLVQLFDVTVPQSPALVSRLFVPDQLNSVALAGNYVLAAGQTGVHIVDISNPKSLAIGNAIPMKSEAIVVKAAGNLGYAAFGSTLALFDIPSGTLLDQRDYSTLPISDLAVAGDYVYVLAAASTGASSYVVTKVAIQNYLDAPFASFRSPATQEPGAGRLSIFAGDHIVYIGGVPAAIASGAAEGFGVEILRDNGSTLTSLGAPSATGASLVRPSGSGLLVFGAPDQSASGQLGILDLSDPTLIGKLLKHLSVSGVVYDLTLYAGQAYVADGSSALQAASFASPTGQKSAPTLTLATNFAAGTAVESSLMRLTASVTGADQIRSVDFFVNDVKVATDGNYPFEYRFVTPDLSVEPSLTIYACAEDIDGNRSCTAPAKVDLEKDKTPLRVLSVTPTDGSHLSRGGMSTLTARFNRPLDVTTIALSSVTLVKKVGSSATPMKLAAVNFQPQTNVVTIQTVSPIGGGAYTATLSPSIKSSSGQPLQGGHSWSFSSDGTATWITAGAGNWSVGANWLGGAPPQTGDDVTIIVSGAVVTVDSAAGSPSIGSLTLGANSQLIVAASSLTVANASTLSGPLSLTGGTTTLNGATSIANLSLEGRNAIMAGSGVVTIGSIMTWTNGTISDIVNVESGATLSATIGYYGLFLAAGVINNAGAVTLNENSAETGFVFSQGGTVNNLAGATWTIQSDSAVGPSDNSAVAFNNAGSFLKSGGTTTTWNVPFSGAGIFNFTEGTINIGAAYNCTGQTQLTGATVNFGGTTAVGNLTLTSGTLGGRTINAGNVTFSATGSVSINFPSVFISISGSASLAGALNLVTPNGYAPALGAVVPLLEFAGSYSGNFSSLTGRTLSNGDFLDEDLISSGLFFKVGNAVPVLQSIAITPANPSVDEGSVQQFMAIGNYSDGSSQNLTNSATWASSATSVATINASGLATGLASGTSNITASFGGITSPADLLTVGLSSSVAYVGLDTATQGTWTAKYGTAGRLIADDATNPPAYATVSLTGDSAFTWAASTSDVRALQAYSGASARIASTYYSAASFTIDVNLTDGNTHRISLYLLDWDGSGRSESISILDAASNAVLSTQAFSNFRNGVYASWNLQGHVRIQVTKTGGSNAVVSGIFFDLVPSASYIGLDADTQGTWTGNYGLDGEIIANDAANLPPFATVSFTGDTQYTWAASTNDVRALQTASAASTRIASAYYTAGTFTINLNLIDADPHQVSLYLLDWDGSSRVESISILDAASNAVLNTQKFSGFHNGEYAVWNIQGRVLIQVTNSGGPNAVVSGMFFN